MARVSWPRARTTFSLVFLQGRFGSPISTLSPSLFVSNCRFSSSTVPPQLKNVGFVGVGTMGSHMANNLIRAGYNLTVHDIDSKKLEKFSKRGIRTAKSSCEIIESSDVVITMLPSPSHIIHKLAKLSIASAMGLIINRGCLCFAVYGDKRGLVPSILFS